MKRVLLMTLACLVTVTSMAIAGTSDDARFALHRRADTTATAKICTTLNPNAIGLACNSFVTTGTGGYSLVYVVVGHGPTVGVNGASFGIDYNGRNPDCLSGGEPGEVPGLDPCSSSFTQCADGLPFTNDGGFGLFPAPKGGIRVTWLTCQQTNVGGFGSQAVIGCLRVYAYGADQLSITGNNNLGPLGQDKELSVASCDGTETFLFEEIGGNPTARSVFPPFAWYSLMGRVDFDGGTGLNPCLIVPARETTWGKIKGLYNQ